MLLKVLTVLMAGVSARVLFFWLRELRFYYRNGWDFSKESGAALEFGDDSGGTIPTTPQKRLFFGYPLLGLVFAVLTFAAGWIAFRS